MHIFFFLSYALLCVVNGLYLTSLCTQKAVKFRLIRLGTISHTVDLLVKVFFFSSPQRSKSKIKVIQFLDTYDIVVNVNGIDLSLSISTVIEWTYKCQPQYRTQQHKLTQQHLIQSPTRLNYCTHAVKTKRGNYNVQDQKRG